MKFSILIISALTISVWAPLQSSAQKVACINSQEILATMPEVKQANSDIEVMKTMFQKKGEEMVKELQTKYQTLQQQQAKGELAPVEMEKQTAALKEEEAKLNEFDKSSQQKIYEKSEELLKPIQERVTQAIKDVAAENGFTYVFDKSTGIILYSDAGADITKLVKTKLGITQ